MRAVIFLAVLGLACSLPLYQYDAEDVNKDGVPDILDANRDGLIDNIHRGYHGYNNHDDSVYYNNRYGHRNDNYIDRVYNEYDNRYDNHNDRVYNRYDDRYDNRYDNSYDALFLGHQEYDAVRGYTGPIQEQGYDDQDVAYSNYYPRGYPIYTYIPGYVDSDPHFERRMSGSLSYDNMDIHDQ